MIRKKHQGSLIAMRIALVVAAGIGLSGLILWAIGAVESWIPVALVMATGGVVAYGAVWYWVARRIALASATLQQIRRHNFEDLAAANIKKGDELNDLIRQVYRTGQVFRSEFEEINSLENYRREFVGNVSHELKTPIFSIRGFAETLMNGALEDPAVNRSFVEKIVRNADRLSSLARDLSEISKLETGEQQVIEETFDLRRLCTDVVDSVEPIAVGKDIQVIVDMPPHIPPVSGDPLRIRQVVVNLVDNAIKYTNNGGRVTVRARQEDTWVQLDVQDDGIGISAEDLPRLTERFFRVDKSRSRSAGGTGLGLSIVKHILAAHKQVLQVDSTTGHGSTFGFRLPARAEVENGLDV